MTALAENLIKKVEKQKEDDFIKSVRSGRKFTSLELKLMGARYKQAYIQTNLMKDNEVMKAIASSLNSMMKKVAET